MSHLPSLFFHRGLDDQRAVFIPGDGPANHNHFQIRIGFDDLQILNRNLFRTHAAGHFNIFERMTRSCRLSGTAGFAVKLRTVLSASAVKAPAFHNALKALTL